MRSFTSSRLVRLLEAWAPAPAEAPAAPADVGERLGPWLSAFDAIGLQAAHQAIRAMPAGPAPRRTPHPLEQDVQRVRATLARAIAAPVEGGAEDGYAPFRERHLAVRHQMDLLLPPLRDHARQVLGRGALPLRQLAALDAAMEQVLAPREQAVLPAVGRLLERRFRAQRDCGADGWRAAFTAEWRQALQAELDLRLEPIAGLAEAYRNEQTTE